MQIRGRITGLDAVEGSYRFEVTKTGPSGRSTINQAGRFVVSAQSNVFVGSAVISYELGDSFDVRLAVEAGGKVTMCASEAGDRI